MNDIVAPFITEYRTNINVAVVNDSSPYRIIIENNDDLDKKLSNIVEKYYDNIDRIEFEYRYRETYQTEKLTTVIEDITYILYYKSDLSSFNLNMGNAFTKEQMEGSEK